MTYAELTRKLPGARVRAQAPGEGEPRDLANPRVNRSAVIPNHPGDLPIGTIRAILKHLGVSREDLEGA